MIDLIKQRKFETVERILLREYEYKKNDIEYLFQLAMVYLQFPFENEENAIKYLDKIIEIDQYNFNALIIKMYLQNYYYNKMDSDFEILTSYNWNDDYKLSIVYYINAWNHHWWKKKIEVEEKIEWINKSIETNNKLVHSYSTLGDLFSLLGKNDDAKKCYKQAYKNVISFDFPNEEALNPQIFIDEYITGVLMSDSNYENLKKKMK